MNWNKKEIKSNVENDNWWLNIEIIHFWLKPFNLYWFRITDLLGKIFNCYDPNLQPLRECSRIFVPLGVNFPQLEE